MYVYLGYITLHSTSTSVDNVQYKKKKIFLSTDGGVMGVGDKDQIQRNNKKKCQHE